MLQKDSLVTGNVFKKLKHGFVVLEVLEVLEV